MNANTALKINDAVDQAIRCGESPEDVLRQVRRAMARALKARMAAETAATQRMIADMEADGLL